MTTTSELRERALLMAQADWHAKLIPEDNVLNRAAFYLSILLPGSRIGEVKLTKATTLDKEAA